MLVTWDSFLESRFYISCGQAQPFSLLMVAKHPTSIFTRPVTSIKLPPKSPAIMASSSTGPIPPIGGTYGLDTQFVVKPSLIIPKGQGLTPARPVIVKWDLQRYLEIHGGSLDHTVPLQARATILERTQGIGGRDGQFVTDQLAKIHLERTEPPTVVYFVFEIEHRFLWEGNFSFRVDLQLGPPLQRQLSRNPGTGREVCWWQPTFLNSDYPRSQRAYQDVHKPVIMVFESTEQRQHEMTSTFHQ